MFQGTLALLNQTLRRDSRKLSVHIVLFLFIGCIFLMVWQGNETGGRFGAPGLELFNSLIWINFIFILLAGFSYFSSAITEEKEEGTLGLLKMTGIDPLVLLFGKSTSRQILASLMLTVQVPFVYLAVTMGGLNPSQIWGAYVALAGFMFFMANLGLYCSVISDTNTNAAWNVLIFGLLFMMGWGAFYFCSKGFLVALSQESESIAYSLLWWGHHALVGEPVIYSLSRVTSTAYDGTVVYSQAFSSLVWGTFFFRLSWKSFETSTSEETPPLNSYRSDYESLNQAAKLRSLTSSAKIKTLTRNKSNRPWKRAIAWKDFYFQAGGKDAQYVKFMLYTMICIMVSMARISDQNSFREALSGTAIWFGLIFTTLESIWLAGRLFRDEIRNNTWSTLLLLPQTFSQVVYGKLLGAFCSLIPAMTFFLAGALIGPDVVITNLFYTPDQFTGTLVADIFFLFGLHLIVYLSLLMPRGAVPVALFLSYMTLVISDEFAYEFVATGQSVVWELLLFYLFNVVVLHFLIGKRLKSLAAR